MIWGGRGRELRSTKKPPSFRPSTTPSTWSTRSSSMRVSYSISSMKGLSWAACMPFMKTLSNRWQLLAHGTFIIWLLLPLGKHSSSNGIGVHDLLDVNFSPRRSNFFQILQPFAEMLLTPLRYCVVLRCIFSHWIFRNSVHNFIGQALRLALADGMHSDMPVQHLEDALTQRYRKIWWTIYILDRSLLFQVHLKKGLH